MRRAFGEPPQSPRRAGQAVDAQVSSGSGSDAAADIVLDQQHSGSIEVDTQPGEFTEFRVILPRKAAVGKAGANQ
jgi:nitrogen-specific signal transduction histidine kinase